MGPVPTASLRARLDESPAIGWVKDLSGRFVYVNHPYLAQLGVSADRLLGHSDAELGPRETVDGPRSRSDEDRFDEPRQLEYTVPAFEGRPALAAVRFVVRDGDGELSGVCGLAAPMEDAQLVHEEAARLMELAPGETESESAPGETESESAPGETESPADPEWPEEVSPSDDHDPRRRWDKLVRKLDGEAERWLAEVEQAHAVIAERDALARELAAERERAGELARTLAQVRSQIAELDRAVERALPVVHE